MGFKGQSVLGVSGFWGGSLLIWTVGFGGKWALGGL